MATILVVDDDPSVRSSLEQALETAGHTVTMAADGTEGMTSYKKGSVDLVITDIFMPESDGIQFIGQLRKLSPKLPIIAVSGNPMGNMLDVARKLGVLAVLEKPFGLGALLNAVDDALKGSSPEANG